MCHVAHRMAGGCAGGRCRQHDTIDSRRSLPRGGGVVQVVEVELDDLAAGADGEEAEVVEAGLFRPGALVGLEGEGDGIGAEGGRE